MQSGLNKLIFFDRAKNEKYSADQKSIKKKKQKIYLRRNKQLFLGQGKKKDVQGNPSRILFHHRPSICKLSSREGAGKKQTNKIRKINHT